MTKHSKIEKKDKISGMRLQARSTQQLTVTAIGADVGDRYTELCALDEEGEDCTGKRAAHHRLDPSRMLHVKRLVRVRIQIRGDADGSMHEAHANYVA